MAKFGLGNKKSVLCFLASGYMLNMHKIIANVANGSVPLREVPNGILSEIEKNPTGLAPAAVGYWFWGKPYRGKL